MASHPCKIIRHVIYFTMVCNLNPVLIILFHYIEIKTNNIRVFFFHESVEALPLEFVQAGATGMVVEPEPEALAAAIDELVTQRQQARQMGENGLEHYRAQEISWAAVVDTLLAP